MQEMKIGQVRFCHKCQQKQEIQVLQSDLNPFLNQSQAQQTSNFNTHVETAIRKDDGLNFWKEFRDVCQAK